MQTIDVRVLVDDDARAETLTAWLVELSAVHGAVELVTDLERPWFDDPVPAPETLRRRAGAAAAVGDWTGEVR